MKVVPYRWDPQSGANMEGIPASPRNWAQNREKADTGQTGWARKS